MPHIFTKTNEGYALYPVNEAGERTGRGILGNQGSTVRENISNLAVEVASSDLGIAPEDVICARTSEREKRIFFDEYKRRITNY